MAFIIFQTLTPAGLEQVKHIGPSTVKPEIASLLRRGNGIPFRLANEAGEHVAAGLLVAEETGAHPAHDALVEYGPKLGATAVVMATAGGSWVQVETL